MDISQAEIREVIRQELPKLIQHDVELQALVVDLSRREFADRARTEDWFTRAIARMDRADERFLAETKAWREEMARDREAQKRKDEEQNRKWEEQNRKWDEQNRKWDANHEEFMALTERVDRRISAMGARWGISSERAFRDALAGILEKSFGVQVLNINEYDDEGTVFGQPDQVELDVIIKNGLLILCELKSSMSKSDMYLFKRKAEWYERRHARQANRLLVVSPMIDHRAVVVGQRLNIEMYTDSAEVEAP